MMGGGEVVKALGGAGERWLHWACRVQSKATSDDYCGVVVRCAGLVADLAWLLVFSILGWEQKRSGKAARVMQEAADSWERLGATGSEWERMGLVQSQRWQWQWEAKRSEGESLPRLCWMCFCLLVDDKHLRQGPQGPVGNNADTPVRDWPPVRPSTERLRDDEVDRARSSPAAEVRRRRRAQL